MNQIFTGLFALLFLTVNPIFSQQASSTEMIPGQLIVRLKQGVDAETYVQQVNRDGRAPGILRYLRPIGKRFNIHHLGFHPGQVDPDLLLDYIRRQSQVESAQFNYHIEFRQTPNDPEYGRQWGLETIQAPLVWDVSTGGLTARGDTIVVAVIDSGFDVNHEDLFNNLWRNRGEIPDDGIDNDGNGYIDDVLGWDFGDSTGQLPLASHGTSVAGIIGAKGNNNTGIAGVNWNVKLMLISIEDVPQIIEAYEYVIDHRDRYNRSNGAQGAFVVATNASFGQRAKFCSEQPVWGGMYDLLGEVGVLTGAGTANDPLNVDEAGDMPTTCPSNFIITVLNTDIDDKRHQGSAYGPVSIDMGAPGQGSYSTTPFNNYGAFGGNSASAPHLTGAIALMYSLPCLELALGAVQQPAQTALFIREALIKGVDTLAALKNFTATGGRLNVFNGMELIGEQCGTTTGDLAVIKVYPNPATGNRIAFEYETPDFEPFEVRIFNALGQLVFRNRITPPRFGVKKEEINVWQWAPGTYFLVVQHDGQRKTAPFVVF